MKNMKVAIHTLIILFAILFSAVQAPGQDYPPLEIGQPAPEFSLPGVDGKQYSLEDFSDDEILVVVFTCNHCPTAQSYEDRIKQMVSDYRDRGVAFVAISPNDPEALRPNELGYSDLGDDLEDMKIRAEHKEFNFPYLYDGETQEASHEYGPVATPHVFIFDRQRRLRYRGRIDDSETGVTPQTSHDARNALDQLLAGEEVRVKTTKTFGCSVKWSEKRAWADQFHEAVQKEEVSLDTIGVAGIKELMKNNSGKLRLINVWATWCGPCVTEFPDLMEINHMYRHRDFELITISADNPAKQEAVLDFLEKHHASNRNYLYNSADQYAMIDAIDVEWQGALPYTVLLKPGGEKIYGKSNIIDPLEMKRLIVGYLGREKDW